ncbi:anti-virulence regulator CigR family protein [Pseudomonas sp. nanlin1]|uniref:anti-virulence regulator CigR family protein n=1 Tax=Pseudomonas sp. nanlin1 TaxID=3040605 RepID=UPI003890103B
MKLPTPLISGLGIVLVALSPLLQAAPGGPGGPDEQRQGPGEQRQQGPQGERGPQKRPAGNNHAQRGGPPQDFGPVRNTIHEHRADFGRGNPPPPDVHIAKGHPLPPGYGKRLDARALGHLPHYPGYEWRRVGTDVVLIALGTGLVYEILSGVLN